MELTPKGRDLALGCMGWFLIGNLLLGLELLVFRFSAWNALGVPLTTVIALGILIYKKRNWLAYGIAVALITNLLIITNFLSDLDPDRMLAALSYPFPLVIMMFMQ